MWWRKLPFDGSLQGKPQVEHRRHSGESGANIKKKELDVDPGQYPALLLKQSLLRRSSALCGSHFKWRVVMAYLSLPESIIG